MLRNRASRLTKGYWNHEPYEYYKGGASPELKHQVFYTAESLWPRVPRGGISLIGPDTRRYGSTPPSKDVWKDFMRFGVHAIQVEGFVQHIWHVAGPKPWRKRIVG